MKLSAIVMTLATAAMFALGSSFASSQTGAPIQVLSVEYSAGYQADTEYDGFTGLQVTFKNVSSQPAKSVLFSVTDSDGHNVGYVSRKGVFSPGVVVKHTFNSDFRIKKKDGPPAKVVVAQVIFADGSHWPATK